MRGIFHSYSHHIFNLIWILHTDTYVGFRWKLVIILVHHFCWRSSWFHEKSLNLDIFQYMSWMFMISKISLGQWYPSYIHDILGVYDGNTSSMSLGTLEVYDVFDGYDVHVVLDARVVHDLLNFPECTGCPQFPQDVLDVSFVQGIQDVKIVLVPMKPLVPLDVNVLTVSSVPLMISLISQVIHYILSPRCLHPGFNVSVPFTMSFCTLRPKDGSYLWDSVRRMYSPLWGWMSFFAFRNNKRT